MVNDPKLKKRIETRGRRRGGELRRNIGGGDSWSRWPWEGFAGTYRRVGSRSGTARSDLKVHRIWIRVIVKEASHSGSDPKLPDPFKLHRTSRFDLA